MVDIQSAIAEIRQEKRKKKTETTAAKYNVRICYAGRLYIRVKVNIKPTNGPSHLRRTDRLLISLT